nr:nuclear envelope pore membrane protein POM 121C [Oryctolagus cuniculus]
MGSYLSKPGPPQPARTQESRDLREKPSRRPAARSPPPTAPAHRVQHVHPALPAPPLRRRPRRPSSRDRGALPDCFVITPRRRYPTQQAQYSLVGVLPTVCWDGCPKKAVLSARNSKMVCGGPGTVRIAPPDSKLMGSPVPAQATHSVLPLPSAKAAVPKASGLNALQERKKRVKGKEDPVFLDGLQSKRRCHDSNGSGHPTAAPQVANGALAAGVPKPGSLKRGLSSQNSHDPSIKRPCPSALAATYTGGIPSSRRNAITSSYSSTQGLSQPHKRSGPSSSSSSSSASSHPQMPKRPEKKTRQQQLRAPCGLVPPKASQGGRVAEPPKSKTEKGWKSPSPPDVSSRRKRKIQLLPCRRGEPLALPPAPQLGYPISAEEYEKEKRAAFQRLNRLLEDKTDAALSSVAKKLPAAQPRVKSTLSAAGSAFPTATLSASSTKKTQKSSGPPAFPESAGVARAVAPLPAKTLAPLPAKTPDLLAPVGASQPAIFPAPAGTSASSKFKSKVVASAESGSEGPLLSGRATTVSSRTTGTSSTVTPNCGIPGPPAPVMPLAIPHSFKHNMAAAPTRPVFAGQASATSSVACVTTASTTTDSALKPAFGFGGRGVPSTQSNATGTTASTTAEAFLFGAPPASGASFAPTEGSTVQFGKPPAMPASATVTTFGQSSSRAAQLATSSTVRFGGLGSTLTTSAPVTPSQPTLMFPKTAPAAFNMPFGSSTKPPLPSYPGANPQATCGAVDRQQKAGKLALALSFGSSLTLGNIAAPAPTATQALAPTQPALGSAPQLSLGGLKSTTAAFSTPGNTKPAFRSATAGSSLGAVTQSTSSGTSSTPFTFGGPAARVGSAGPNPRGATQVTTSTAEVLSFRSRQSGTIVNAASSGGTLSQKSLAAPSQDPGVLNVASTHSSKPVAGGTSARTFAQNAPAPALGTAGGSLSFGVSSTSTHGLARIGSFRSEAPSFSIGAAPKTPGPRQRLQARRQQPRKK